MTREQKLRRMVMEIEESLSEFSNELERVSEENLAKSDRDYYKWVHNRFFDSEDTLVERLDSETTSYINTLQEAVSMLCDDADKKTKVTLCLMGDSHNTTLYMDNKGFELIKEDLLKCPICDSWVHKDCFKCDCGHPMGTREDVIEFTLSNGVIERTIRDSQYSNKHELVIDGVTYPAEYMLVPKGTDVKEFIECKNYKDKVKKLGRKSNYQYRRELLIKHWVNANPRPTMNELVKIIGYSRRTLERDIALLKSELGLNNDIDSLMEFVDSDNE